MPNLVYDNTFDESGLDGKQPQSWDNYVSPYFKNIRTLLNTTGLDAVNLGVTAGQVTASKALVVDASRNLADGTASNQINNLTLSGTFTCGTVSITGGSVSGITDLAVADGGTGASTASAARTNLGLVIGSDVQAYDAELQALSGLTPTDGNFIVGNGSTFITEDAATSRTSLGLGSIATQASNSVSITGGSVTGITDVTVADGGTGASDAAGARTNLGLVIGTNVQAYDAGLADIAGLATSDGNVIVGSGSNWVAESGATARTSLGLGSIATQASDSVSITGGAVTGITDITVADGGTGASNASGARTNLGVAIGSDVQAYDAGLADIAALATSDGNIIVGSGSNWVAESGATARTSLGLGSIATQNANAVSISGGSLTGMTSYSGGTISGTTGTFSSTLGVTGVSTLTGRVGIGGSTITDLHLLNIQGSTATDNVGLVLNKTNSTAQIWAINNTGTLNFHNQTTSLTPLQITSNNETTFKPSSSNGNLVVKVGSINSDSIRLEAGGTTSTYLEYRGYLGHSWYVDSTRKATLDATGLGVGQDSPSVKIHASGSSTNSALRLDESNSSASSYLGYIDTSGNFGIDINGGGYLRFALGSAERVKFNANGDVDISGEKLKLGGTTNNGVINNIGSVRINIDSDANGTGEYFAIGHNQESIDANNELFRVQEDGRVAIGTQSPDAPLHVESATASDLIKVEGTGADSNPNIQIANDARSYNLQVVGARSDAFEIWDRTAGATRLSISTSGTAFFYGAEASFGTDTNNRGIVNYGSNVLALSTVQSGSTYYDTVKITGGQVGIGTSPTSTFTVQPASNTIHVQKIQNAAGNVVQETYVNGDGNGVLNIRNSAGQHKMQFSTYEDSFVAAGFDFGFGTSTPKGIVDIAAAGKNAAGDISDVDDYALVIRCSSTTNEGNGIAFTNDGGDVVGGSIIHQDKGSANTGDLVFYTRDTVPSPNASVLEAMRITNTQRIGIGTDAPSRLLHVNGTEGVARFTSTASGSDGLEVGIGTSSQAFIWQAKNSYLQFATNNTERLRILSSGGLTFNGDTADANALDDYEEGTYSVTDQSGAGLSFTVNSNKYIKIGKLVFVSLEIIFPTTSNTSGVRISLPFANNNTQRGAMSVVTNRSDVQLGAYVSTLSAAFGLTESAASPVSVTNASLSGKYVIVSGCYEATA